MTPIRCDYSRSGGRIVGRCVALDLESEPWFGRDRAEEEIVRLVLAKLTEQQGQRVHFDDVVFVHAATMEAAAA